MPAYCRGSQILLSARLPDGGRVARHRSAAPRLADGGALHQDSGVTVDGNLTRRQ